MSNARFFEAIEETMSDGDTFRYFCYFAPPWSVPVAGIRVVVSGKRRFHDRERHVPYVFEADGRCHWGKSPRVWPPYSPALNQRYQEFLKGDATGEVGPVWTEGDKPVVIIANGGSIQPERQAELVYERVGEEYDVLSTVSPHLASMSKPAFPVTDWANLSARDIYLIYRDVPLATELARLHNRVFVTPPVQGPLLNDPENETSVHVDDHRQSTQLLEPSKLLEFLASSELMLEPSEFDSPPRFHRVQGDTPIKKTSAGLLRALECLSLEVRYRPSSRQFEISRDQGATWTTLGENQRALLRDHIAANFSSDVNPRHDAWFDDDRWANAWKVIEVTRAVR